MKKVFGTVHAGQECGKEQVGSSPESIKFLVTTYSVSAV